jgi:lipoate-protein ligase B
MPSRELWVVHLGLRPYAEVLELQRAVAAARIAGEVRHDVLLLVEHPPVVTLGRGARDASNVIASEALLASRGVERFEVDRGGDVTFHGHGQLVGYPIIDLTRHRQDLHWYLRQVEDLLIRALHSLGINAEQRRGLTGVWTGGRKIASIGVHARQWVTWHGFALNVTTDLSYFDLIVPCGIPGVTMTSVEQELLLHADSTCLAPSPTLAADAEEAVIAAAAAVFALEPVQTELATLQVHAAPAP